MYQDLELNEIYLPVLFELSKESDRQKFNDIISVKTDKIVLDLFSSQKKELFKIRSPKQRLSPADTDAIYDSWIENRSAENEGIWVYYPWLNKMIHILDKEEFIELRTSRNKFKITPSEQTSLFSKKIGIIGLSVGHAVALSIATERICSTLKLADFDTIELSNLNRIKTGIQNIGLNKCVVTAREIAEIDPFINIECYQEGLTDENLEAFLLEGGKLDILVDECDGLEMKIACRQMAKKYQIPVVMETSDKGMLDVERFDLEADRSILHGFLDGIPPERLKNISPEDRLPLVLKIVDAKNSSLRGQLSLIEVGQSISTWPQLASAVTLGGGVVTDVCRRILLDQYNESGRYYVDLEKIIGNKNAAGKSLDDQNPFNPFSLEDAIKKADSFPGADDSYKPDLQVVSDIVEAAGLAPSNANDQPWKWLYRNGRLFLFHDEKRSFSFANFSDIAAHVSLGAAYENLLLKTNQHNLKVKSELFPLPEDKSLIAIIDFYKDDDYPDFEPIYDPESVAFIENRSSNRSLSQPVLMTPDEIKSLAESVESVQGGKIYFITDREKILSLGKIIGESERITLLNKAGHKDFYERNIRWTPDHADLSGDGIDVREMGMIPAQIAALSIIKDPKIAEVLKTIGGANALVDGVMRTASLASGIGLITVKGTGSADYFAGGIALQRLWLKAEQLGFAIHPLNAPLYLFARLNANGTEGLDNDEVEIIRQLRAKFIDIIPVDENVAETFLFKIAKADKPAIKSKRLPLSEILFIDNKAL
ncbi:Rv1355c family protein [Dyadobacter sp. CY345]|uniref:Rv1355c family protein n=1 Tax=Dyadobacter sp. CY345 TaxID=2909335 RepID=UPI001EFF9B4B|nr:Rv1355c family protein [Dyadobacter sp. CY345]MCF2443173.1 Rv1355c family protein [Dyadobacter sp. CY345]